MKRLPSGSRFFSCKSSEKCYNTEKGGLKMQKRIQTLWRVFFTFFKIGAFTFGGGYAMIPLIQRETVEKNGWISDDDILEVVAIAESTPGPIAINAATFIGYRVAGVLGALCATLGVVLPSFVVILAISGVLRQFQHVDAVRYAFVGIRAGVLALIVKAFWGMLKKAEKSAVSYAIMTCVFAAVVFWDISVIFLLLLCAILGLGVTAWKGRKAK
jgi:chromate transporter